MRVFAEDKLSQSFHDSGDAGSPVAFAEPDQTIVGVDAHQDPFKVALKHGGSDIGDFHGVLLLRMVWPQRIREYGSGCAWMSIGEIVDAVKQYRLRLCIFLLGSSAPDLLTGEKRDPSLPSSVRDDGLQDGGRSGNRHSVSPLSLRDHLHRAADAHLTSKRSGAGGTGGCANERQSLCCPLRMTKMVVVYRAFVCYTSYVELTAVM